MMLLLNNIDR